MNKWHCVGNKAGTGIVIVDDSHKYKTKKIAEVIFYGSDKEQADTYHKMIRIPELINSMKELTNDMQAMADNYQHGVSPVTLEKAKALLRELGESVDG